MMLQGEEKYKWSKYIAEPVNTFTNLLFFALSLWGARKVYEEKMPTRFILTFLGGGGIGVGSFAFHASLKYQAQLLDELPMIYTMALFLYTVLESTPGYGKPRFRILLPTVLISLVTFVTVAYIYLGNPIFHQAAYGIMQTIATLQVVRLMKSKRTSLSEEQRKEISQLFVAGIGLFLAAFALWNVDNIFCSNLRLLRHKIGYPWAILLEGHGWWHIGTGLGGYIFCTAAQKLMLSIKEEPDNFVLKWNLGFVPYVSRMKAYKGRKPSAANGSSAISQKHHKAH